MEDDEVRELLDRLRAGEETAAVDVFNRFARRLVALARTRLEIWIRAKVDPEDVVQSVFRSFFVRSAQGEFDVRSQDSLWALLAVITVRKCGHQNAFFRAARRDLAQEFAPVRDEDGSFASWQIIGREPTPSDAAILVETLDGLLRHLSARDRAILEAHLQGATTSTIANEVGCTERTVQRVLKNVRSWLLRFE